MILKCCAAALGVFVSGSLIAILTGVQPSDALRNVLTGAGSKCDWIGAILYVIFLTAFAYFITRSSEKKERRIVLLSNLFKGEGTVLLSE